VYTQSQAAFNNNMLFITCIVLVKYKGIQMRNDDAEKVEIARRSITPCHIKIIRDGQKLTIKMLKARSMSD